MVANAQVKFTSLAFGLFCNMIWQVLVILLNQLLSFDSIKRHNHFWWGTSEFSDLILIYQYFVATVSFDSFDVILNSYLRSVFLIGSHPSLEGVGFVSPGDLLIGLAIIQAFPGPNFNCE